MRKPPRCRRPDREPHRWRPVNACRGDAIEIDRPQPDSRGRIVTQGLAQRVDHLAVHRPCRAVVDVHARFTRGRPADRQTQGQHAGPDQRSAGGSPRRRSRSCGHRLVCQYLAGEPMPAKATGTRPAQRGVARPCCPVEVRSGPAGQTRSACRQRGCARSATAASRRPAAESASTA